MNGERLSFIGLLKKYKIEFPAIQRDYIQGRPGNVTKDFRTKFIDDVCDRLLKNEPCNLNYVYGTESLDGYTFLLDGQQRITTLFLLHFYLACKSDSLQTFAELIGYDPDSKTINRFKYNTRYTTQRFLEQLIEKTLNNEDLKNGIGDSQPISDIVKQQNWYAAEYEEDISVISYLTVLDCLQNKLKDTQAGYSDLKAERINFLFIAEKEAKNEEESSKIEKPHDHYIKMNSRGKKLTNFELFKSSFERELKNIGDDEAFGRIKENIDESWYEICAEMVKNKNHDNREAINLASDIDDLYRGIIHSLFCVQMAKKTFDKSSQRIDAALKEWRANFDPDNALLFNFTYPISDQDDNNGFPMKYYADTFIAFFDHLKRIRDYNKQFFEQYVEPIITGHFSLPGLVFICALSKLFLSLDTNCSNEQILSSVLFFRNLIENDEIDNPEKSYRRCVNLMGCDGDSYKDINTLQLTEFPSALVNEFKFIHKAVYTDHKIDLNKCIELQEQSKDIFDGRLFYAYKMAEDGQNVQSDYSEHLERIIENSTKILGTDNYHKIIQYLLAKDTAIVYSETSHFPQIMGKTRSGIYTFGFSKDSHDQHNWKGLMNIGDGCEYYSKLKDILLSNNGNVIGEIDEVINAYKNSHSDESFKTLLVKYSGLLEKYIDVKGKIGRFWYKDNENIYIMKNKVRKTYIHFKLAALAEENGVEPVFNQESRVYEIESDLSYVEIQNKKIYYSLSHNAFCDQNFSPLKITTNGQEQEVKTIAQVADYLRNHN